MPSCDDFDPSKMMIFRADFRNMYIDLRQVHKAVLNMLLHPNIELLPMKNTETAWTFVGRNFAEGPIGQDEMLAVRFKTIELTNAFRDRVVQVVRVSVLMHFYSSGFDPICMFARSTD